VFVLGRDRAQIARAKYNPPPPLEVDAEETEEVERGGMDGLVCGEDDS
jgi:hypothetical protein